ncbi:ribosome recycling factor [Alphaproteobacteria bacterium]|nr:ribosome recycling factor [Alphaproteobacteria bacterium]
MLEELYFVKQEDLDSYSDAFEARTRDRFDIFVNELRSAGSSDESKKILYGLRMQLNGKERRVTDIAESFVRDSHIDIRMLNTEAMPALAQIIKEEKGFTKIDMIPEQQLMRIALPKPTLEQKLELNDYVENRLTNFKKNVMSVKSQTGQQIKAGLDKEYIQPLDAAKAGKNIEKISEHYVLRAKMLTLLKQKSILKSQFTFNSEEEKTIFRKAKPYASIMQYVEDEDEE